MKTLAFLLALGALAMAQPAFAKPAKSAKKASHESRASSGEAKNLVSVSPMVFLSSASSFGATIGYERAIGEMNSVIVQGLYQSSGPAAANLTNLGIGGGYRWYLLGPGMLSGLYVGPKLGLVSSTYSYEYSTIGSRRTYTSNASLFKVMAEAGYQAKFWENMVAGANFELSYTSGTLSTVSGYTAVDLSGTNLGTYASVGWAF